MIRKPFRLALSFLLLAGCAVSDGAPPERHARAPFVPGNVDIYRGVRVLPGLNNTHIDWSNASFGVSGQPVPTLSFFDAAGNTQPCWLRVTVAAPNVPVLQGQGGDVTLTIPPLPVGPAPSPWAAVFDDIPAGHWSITKATITNGAQVSNAVAGTWAAAVFRASTVAGQVTIVDGSTVGCQI